MLPEWLDASRLSFATIGGIVVLAVVAVIVIRVVRKLATAMLIVIVLAVAAIALGIQWTGLRDCQQTCSCSVFGMDVQVPQNPLCGENRLRVDLDINRG